MSAAPCTVVVGGTSGIGLAVARLFADRGGAVVVTGRDAGRAEEAAKDLGGDTRGLAFDLAQPDQIQPALADIGPVANLILVAIERDLNSVREYRPADALRLATLKLVGYAEVVHALCDRLSQRSAVVLFGGRAKDRPYPGSTMVSTVNGGVSGLMRTLAVELAPVRVNAIHPGLVGDSPFWAAKPAAVLDAVVARTPCGQLATMADIVDAVDFLVRNKSVNGIDLYVDGGTMLV
jgi:NAD(P)-dependent dehydrogenase (short-subunit alcohol dehydrogenase family)